MKTKLLSLAFFAMCSGVFAQELSEEFPRNELKINAAYLLAGIIEMSYERSINEDSSFGISANYDVAGDSNYTTMISPYYRLFFSKNHAAGFFFETSTTFLWEQGDDDIVYYSSEDVIYPDSYYVNSYGENVFGWGLGIAVGGKFLTSNNWVFEVVAGLGRNFINTDEISDLYPRLGISIGKRF